MITSTIVALASVRQHLQPAATELGEDLTVDIVLALKELDGPASTRLGCALRLPASPFNSLSEKCRKEAVSKSWGNKSEHVEQRVPPCLGSLFKGNFESAFINFFDRKQHF